MNQPTREELIKAVADYEEAFSDLFAQCCSNPVKNAWGQTIDFTKLNIARQDNYAAANFCREAVKNPMPEAPVTAPVMAATPAATSTNIQKYLENFDEYSFTDLLLRDMVEEEQRRQSKNCPEVESEDSIMERYREEMRDSIDMAVFVVKALSHAAKGVTE